MRVEDAYHAHIPQNETSAKSVNNFLREKPLNGYVFKIKFIIFQVMLEENIKRMHAF